MSNLDRNKNHNYTLSLTMPNFSDNGALTILSQNVVTNLDIISSDDIIIKLTNEFKTVSKS